MSTRTHIVLEDGLLERIDGVRGDVPRSKWIQRAVESALPREVAVAESERLLEDVKRADAAGTLDPSAKASLVRTGDLPVEQNTLDPRRDRVAVALEARSASASAPYLSCPAPGCTFKARSPQAKCSVHGRTVR